MDDACSIKALDQSNTKLIIKFGIRNINQQQQPQCSKEAEKDEEKDQRRVDQPQPQPQCSKEAEEEVKNMSVRKQNLSSNHNSPKSILNNSDSSSATTCSICGKSFPSKQSLFGHMRSHPEREWRGIQPPPSPSPSPSPSLPSQSFKFSIKNNPSSSGSDDSWKSAESYQGVGALPVNWSATGKRGRKSYDLLLSDERIPDAVAGLLMLKEGNGITTSKNKKNKRIVLESSSEEVSRSSDLVRSSKKLKIDQERSCGSSRDGFDPKLINNNIQSSQWEEQLLPSNMFQEDCGLVMKKNNSKKLKLDERSCRDPKLMNSTPSSHLEQSPSIGFHGDFSLVKNSSKKVKLDERSCGSSRDMFDPKLINSISSSHLEQFPSIGFHGDFSLVKNSSKNVKLDERSYSTSKDRFDPKLINSIPSNHMEEMYSNGFHGDFSLVKNSSKKLKLDTRSCSTSRDGFDPKLINSIPSSNVEQMPPNGYFQGEFSAMFSKPEILMKATANKKQAIKVREIERGSSADQDLGLQGSYEFKCHTCNRTFPSHQALGGHKSSQRNCKNSNSTSSSSSYQFSTHDHQYYQCREPIPKLMIQAADHDQLQEYISETKTTTSSYIGTHQCELCGVTFGSGQALGGHKRRHYTGGLNPSGTVPVDSTAMALTEKMIKKEIVTSLSAVPVASSVGEEVISTTKTENKLMGFDLNELPDELPDE